VTREGNYLWFSDQNYGYIGKATTGGSLMANFNPHDDAVRGVTWDGVHIWAVNTSGALKKFTTAGTLVEAVSGLLTSAWGLTFDGTHLWASDPVTDRIYQISMLSDVTSGDVNGDGNADRLDVVAVVNHMLAIETLQEDALLRADCDGDGNINVLDALGIVNVILGIGTCGPDACKLQVTPEVADYLQSLTSSMSSHDLAALMALMKSETAVPEEYNLAQNNPNPFNAATTIHYALPVTGERGLVVSPLHTTLKIYNTLGQEMRTLVDEIQEGGNYTVTWDASDMPSGVYFYRLTSGDFAATKRMVLVK